MRAALAAGLALHAVETVTGLAFGALGTGLLLRHRRVTGLTQGRCPRTRQAGRRSTAARPSTQGGTMRRTLPPAAPAGCGRCGGRRGRARVDDAGRGQGIACPQRDADPAPGRDLPGERLVRPLLRHVPERGEHRRASRSSAAPHTPAVDGLTPATSPSLPAGPAAQHRPDRDEPELVAADPARHQRQRAGRRTATASSRATRITTTATSSRPSTAG